MADRKEKEKVAKKAAAEKERENQRELKNRSGAEAELLLHEQGQEGQT